MAPLTITPRIRVLTGEYCYVTQTGPATSPTEVGTGNAGRYITATILASTWYPARLTEAGTQLHEDLAPRVEPASPEALLAWGRGLRRTGAKKIDLDL